VVVILAGLAAQGRLRGELVFFSQMGPMAVYGSLESALLEWFHFLPQATNVLLYGALFLTACGAGLHLCAAGPGQRQAASVALATGLLAAVTMSKQIMRQGVANQMTIYVAVGGALTLWLLRGSASRSQRAVVLLGAGFALTAGWHPEELSSVFREKLERLAQLPRDVQLLTHPAVFQAAQASYFGDEQRYPAFLPLIRRLKELSGWQPGRGPERPFYVLGDESALYVALDQKPPWYITFYNESPVEAQQEVVRWIRSVRPEFVVWNPGYTDFDGVPNVVRAPLVFDEIIADYAPTESVGEFDILRRHPDGSPPALDYWKAKLGRTLDLRALPSESVLRSAPVCSGLEGCAEVVKVRTSGSGQTITIPIRAAGETFEVKFTTRAGVNEYLVNLRHVWFWGALARLGCKPELGTPAQADMIRLERVNPGSALY
jgi:hypothetical protein